MSNWNSEFNKVVGHYSMYQDPPSDEPSPGDFIKVIDSDIGRKVGFERVAVHHIVLPPHFRTSSPHAESLEEEFVYVVKGDVDLWLNGHIHQLKAAHAVGFPAGTGVAHTFINNSNSEVHLIVAGEATKSDNLCSFPINPELENTCSIWWENPPVQNIGPHNGLPGKVNAGALAESLASNIVYCPGVEKSKNLFNYPGDSETFGCGFRISDKVGLKALGIHYEVLEPGQRSAFPHAHTHEEEFVFVIKGAPTVFMNGYTKQMVTGDFAAFPANTGINHAIINDTQEDVYYICIGESEEFPDEKISYPFNSLRTNECKRKSWAWLNPPKLNYGSHGGLPKSPTKGHMSFRLCSPGDAGEVLDIFKQSPVYFERTEGCLPNIKLAEQFIVDTPRKKNENYFKEFLIIEHEGAAIGALDLHVNHPKEKNCYIGLLLIKENLFGKGLGTKSYQLLEDYIKRGLECNKIYLGVSEDNDVAEFWLKRGFKPSGNSYTWTGQNKETLVQEYKKNIP